MNELSKRSRLVLYLLRYVAKGVFYETVENQVSRRRILYEDIKQVGVHVIPYSIVTPLHKVVLESRVLLQIHGREYSELRKPHYTCYKSIIKFHLVNLVLVSYAAAKRRSPVIRTVLRKNLRRNYFGAVLFACAVLEVTHKVAKRVLVDRLLTERNVLDCVVGLCNLERRSGLAFGVVVA